MTKEVKKILKDMIKLKILEKSIDDRIKKYLGEWSWFINATVKHCHM